MSKKKTNRNFLIIAAVLLGILLATRIFKWTSSDTNYRDQIQMPDTTGIVKIEIIPGLSKGKPKLTLSKESDNSWTIIEGDKRKKANPASAADLLNAISEIKPNQLVAKKKENWGNYELSDSSATEVLLFKSNEAKPQRIFIGKISFKQVQGMGGQSVDGTSYVRLGDRPEVFGTKGFLSFTFNREFSNFLDGTLYSGNASSIQKLDFNLAETGSFTLEKKEGNWYAGELPMDSTVMANYLSQLASYQSSSFAEEQEAGAQIGKITIYADAELLPPAELSLYESTSEEYWLLRSTRNPENLFKLLKTADWENKFKALTYFQGNTEAQK